MSRAGWGDVEELDDLRAGPPGGGLGLLEFAPPEWALKARDALHGRKFDGPAAEATVYFCACPGFCGRRRKDGGKTAERRRKER